jgi:hypothetical protein
MKSLHRIKLDVFQVSYRHCRPYMEKIDDFYESGAPRFQWDMIRQAYMLRNDSTLPAICGDCPLNLTYQPEGCQSEVLGINIFLKVLTKFKAEAELLKYNLYDDILDVDSTRRLLADIEEADQLLQKLKWPIAQVYFKGAPVGEKGPDGALHPIYYEWDGEEEDNYSQGSEGYFWGRTQEGIVVKDSFGNRIDMVFKRLFKEGFGIYGESLEGKLHTFIPVMGHFPSWDDIGPRRNSELIATEIQAEIVFKDLLNIMTVFCQEALRNNTGLQFTYLG